VTFEASRARVPELIVLDEVGSTNDALAERAPGLAAYATLVTDRQTAGRGRRDRAWSTAPGRGLAISVLLPPMPLEAMGWLPIIAGLAMRDAAAALLPGRDVSLKWPNDVLVGERKLCGVLAQLAGDRVVMGAGVNTRMRADELPVPTATSLAIEGADPDGLDDRILGGYLGRLRALADGYLGAGGDPDASGLRDAVRSACGTLGREVRVELPGGRDLVGTAEDIASDARLVVRTAGGVEAVAAGDVVHLRPATN
jgi:BirA family biotin operon repressor/biotin-[acetyl-CoA-carboxylase] ligase